MGRISRAVVWIICLVIVGLGGGGIPASFPSAGQAAAEPGASLGLTPQAYVPLMAYPACETDFLRKGPQVILTGNNTEMKVVWQLDATLPSTLQWGPDLQYSLGYTVTAETGPAHQHSYTIGHLTPGARYYYRVFAGTACAAGSFYAPPPGSASSLKFFAYGDTRNGIAINDTIAGQINAIYTVDSASQTFILAAGDLVSSGDLESSWRSEFFDSHYSNLRAVFSHIAFLPVMGNHEGGGALFKRYFPMPFAASRYWSFDYGPAHVVMLDQYVPYGASSLEYTWLRDNLAASQKMWKFIVLHEPGWSAGGGHANNPTVQAAIQPLAEQYGVSVIFGGHNHYYARAVVNGVTHLTVGGGGAPLYTPVPGANHVVTAWPAYSFAKIVITGNVLTGTIVQLNGDVIDTFTVRREPLLRRHFVRGR